MTSQPAPRRSKAEASEQTRAALLDAGAELLREQPVGAVLPQVTAPEVARRAGRTIGAFYHHWPDQDSYRRALLRHVLAPEQLPTDTTVASVAQGLSLGVPLDEIVRLNGRANFDHGIRPEFVLSVALWGQVRTDPHVRDVLRQQFRSSTDKLVPMYEALLSANGWVPRPPFTLDLIAVTITALVEGIVIRAGIEPDVVPLALPDEQGRPTEDDGTAWDLFSTVLLALLPMLTMPADAVPPSDPPGPDPLATRADARDAVRAIWSHWARDVRAATDGAPPGPASDA